jgi:hypothetical protein
MVTDKELYCRTIAAVTAYYGYTYIACIRNVNIDDLRRWAAGQRRPLTHVFSRIIDLANGDAEESTER